MRTVDLEVRALRSSSILLGEEFDIHDSEIVKRWQEVLALAENARKPGGGSIEPALRELGRALAEKPLGEVRGRVGVIGPDTVLCIMPGKRETAPEHVRRRFDFWCRAERLPFEAAADDRGFLIDQGIGTIRILGGQADAPLVIGKDRLRVLVIAASPKDHDSRGLLGGLKEVHKLLAEAAAHIPIDFEGVEGPGTWTQLARVADKYPRWDIVHIVAHGQRGSAPGAGPGTILVETDDGHASVESYPVFANRLCSTVKGVRLFSLAVCDSSPLALELAYRCPSASAIGLLSETRQSVADGLFGRLYGRLLDLQQCGETNLPLSVGHVVRQLKDAGESEWFLAVTYVPADVRALFDWRGFASSQRLRTEAILRRKRIEDLARSGQLEKAKKEAFDAGTSPDPELATWAKNMVQELQVLLDCQKGLSNLEEQVARECSVPSPGWGSLYDRLQGSRLETAPICSIRTVRDCAPLPDVVSVLRDVKAKLEDHFQVALAGLRDLSEYERGKFHHLIDGCAKLLGFIRARRSQEPTSRGPLAAEALRDVVKRGLADRLGEIDALLAALNRDRANAWTALRRAAQALSEVGLVIERAARDLDSDFGEERRRAAVLFELLRDAVEKDRVVCSPVQPSSFAAPPPELLTPERRAELVEWMLAERAAPVKAEAPKTLQALRELLERPGDRKGGPDFDLHALPPALWTVIANLQVPVRPVAAVARPEDVFHPLLLLAGHGIDADAPMERMSDVATDVTGCSDHRRWDLLVAAANQLTRDDTRLQLDIAALPCANPALITQQLPLIAQAVLAGKEPQLDVAKLDLDAKDRLSLLVLAGRTQEAAALAVKLATETKPGTLFEQFETLRAAFLALAHATHLAALSSQTSTDAFTELAQQAMAVLGMLLGNPEALATWIRRRLGFYRLVCPEDLEDRINKVSQELRRPLDQALTARAASAPEESRQLFLALETELDGARLSPRLMLRRQKETAFVGGFLAARMCGCTEEVGRRIARLYGRLAPLDLTQRLKIAGNEGITEDLIHNLVFAFSRLRLLGKNELRRLLPSEVLVAGAVAECAELLTAADDFPMHAALPDEDKEPVLSAHIAIRLGKFAFQEVADELGHGGWGRPRVKGLVEIVASVSEYLRAQNYRLGEDTVPGAKDLVRLVIAHAEGLRQRMAKDSQKEPMEPQEKEVLLKRGQEACAFLELLCAEPRVAAQPEFATVRARFYFNFSSFLANHCDETESAYKHMKVAFDAEPNNPHFIKNHMLATAKEAQRLSFKMNDLAKARELVAGMLKHAELHLQKHPDDANELQVVMQTIRDLRLEPGPRLAQAQKLF
jgi:hypothetical protein